MKKCKAFGKGLKREDNLRSFGIILFEFISAIAIAASGAGAFVFFLFCYLK